MPTVKIADAYAVSIFMAGDFRAAQEACRSFCNDIGLCVTVTPTSYIYTGGDEDGIIVGLINYARFPKEDVGSIWEMAEELAFFLRLELGQESFTIQDHIESRFYSWRKQDQ